MNDTNITKLAVLIQTHPSWPAIATDYQALKVWAIEKVYERTVDELPNEKILEVILGNVADYNSLTEANRNIVGIILQTGNTVPTAVGNPTRDRLVAIFNGKTDTLQALGEAIKYQVSRAVDADITGAVDAGAIKAAIAETGV